MEQENGPSLSSAFPPPPPFYKFFTSENLQLLKSGNVPDSPEKKRELQFLIPPAAPVEGAYSTFGDRWPLPERLPSLTEMNMTQLYSTEPNQDRTVELRNLTKSALMNYLELVGIMGVDPAGWTEKVEDLRIIFINMHHLLNEYRPHQARETLCMMMEEEIERTREEIKGIEEACEKVEQVLEKVFQSGAFSNNQEETQVDNGKMEDVVQENPTKEELRIVSETGGVKWFENEKLLNLWNGSIA